jgi:hypothetical protein
VPWWTAWLVEEPATPPRVILGAGAVIPAGLAGLGALPRPRADVAAPVSEMAGTEGGAASAFAVVEPGRSAAPRLAHAAARSG